MTDPILESSTKPTADRDNEEFFINLLEGNSRDADKWYATLETSGKLVSYLLDAGA